MARVFISHVEEDSEVALRIADALEATGFQTWCYERNAVPGPSYLLQTGTQVEESAAFLLLISRDSLGSRQVTAEVVRAHESGRPFIPVLVDITHAEFAARQPEWREAVGSATSISLEPGGVEALVPRIVQGLDSFGVERGGEESERPAPVYRVGAMTGASAPSTSRTSPRRRVVIAVGAAIAVGLAGVGFAIAVVGGGPEKANTKSVTTASDTDDGGESGATETTTTSTTETSQSETASPSGTPFATSFGSMVVRSASLTQEACPPPGIPGQCLTAGGSDRYLVLVLAPASGGGAALSQPFLDEAYASSILHSAGSKAGAFSIYLQEATGTIEIVYGVLPESAGEKDVVLLWSSNPALLIDV